MAYHTKQYQIKLPSNSTDFNWTLPNKRVWCSSAIEQKTFLRVRCPNYNLGKQNQMVISACKLKNLNFSLPLGQAVLNSVPAIKNSNVQFYSISIFFCELHFIQWPYSITLFRPTEFWKMNFLFPSIQFFLCEFQFIPWTNCPKLQTFSMPPPHLFFHLNQTLK